MQRTRVNYDSEFEVISGNRRSQAAVMVLPPGESEGDRHNKHKGADQWLYVRAGKGVATIKGRNYRLAPGVLVLIEHGETHEIRNNGKEPLETLNFYVPPAYNKNEEELPAGKSS